MVVMCLGYQFICWAGGEILLRMACWFDHVSRLAFVMPVMRENIVCALYFNLSNVHTHTHRHTHTHKHMHMHITQGT